MVIETNSLQAACEYLIQNIIASIQTCQSQKTMAPDAKTPPLPRRASFPKIPPLWPAAADNIRFI
jgi:hypothetical protein